MKNIFNNESISKLKSFCAAADRIVVISHTNPDGDAMGSGLALTLFLRELGYKVRFFVPNHYPKFLAWVDQQTDVEIFGEMCREAEAYLAAADLVICVDFNQVSRLERMTSALENNLHAPRILIDHHQSPPQFDLSFSDTDYSSTSLMVFELIERWAGVEAITLPMANALYLGIMTDTGGFSYSNLTPQLYRAVAELVERGVDPVAINRAVFNTQSESRLRMVGYLLSEKMRVFANHGAAYITLTQQEKLRFNHQIGDTEGIVNMPLAIAGITFSAIFIETSECIKVSLRSEGEMDVNLMAREHFNGGGHRNAAGGKFFGTMEQAEAKIQQIISTL